MSPVKLWLLQITLLFSVLTSTVTWGADLRLSGNTMSLHTRNESIQDVLRSFADYGITVRVQAGVEARVDGDITNQPIEDALDLLLGEFGYITYWREFPYSATRLRVLDRIDVFPVGGQATGWTRLPRQEQRLLTLPSGAKYVADEILIGMRPGTSREDFEGILRSIGGQIVEVNAGVGMYRIRLPANSNVTGIARELSKVPGIGAAEPNLAIELPDHAAAGARTPTPADWNDRTTHSGAPAIAVLDSGLSPGLAGASFIQATYDSGNPNAAITDPVGHGSHMSLIASSSVAPNGATTEEQNSKVVAVKAFDDNGVATSFQLVESLQYALEKGAPVVSMSWGTYEKSAFMEVAMQQAVDANMILLAATGNDGKTLPMYPAAYDQVLAIAATDASGNLWPKSNTGPHVDLAAPGTARFPHTPGVNGGNYAGTSISTPWVANAISHYWGAHPEKSAEEIKQDLLSTLSPVSGTGIRQLDAAARNRFLDR